jgi:hypothetical protein
MSETRCLYVWLLYNWVTRAKRFLTNEEAGPDSVGEFVKGWQPVENEHLYLLQGEVKPPESDTPYGHVTLSLVREADETRCPLGKDESILTYVAGRLSGEFQKLMPPGSFGPEIGGLCGASAPAEETPTKRVYYISVPGHGWKMTVEETQPWQFGKLGPKPWDKPPTP